MSVDTDIVTIAQAIEDRLIAVLPVRHPALFSTFDASQIVWAIEDVPQLKGDYDIVLKLNRESNIIPVDDGGGRSAMRCSQTIDVFVRTQTAISQLGNDKEKIRKHFGIQRPIFDVLSGVMLANADDLDLLTRPLQWLGTTLITKKNNPPARHLWGLTAITFEAHFKPLPNSMVLD